MILNTNHDRKVKPRKFWVPGKYRARIISHLIERLARKPGPSMLLVVGEPGTGKTFAIRGLLGAMGANIIQIDARLIESAQAGEPVRQLEKAFLQAASLVRKKQAAAIFFDDLDTIMGRLGAFTQYTCNLQLIHEFLMTVCDDPRRVFGPQTPTIPLFATANRVDVLPEPLIRSGRAEVLSWDLTLEDKSKVVGPIFGHLKESEVTQLVTGFPTEPVAFFSDLKKLWNNAVAQEELTRTEPRKALRLALHGQWQTQLELPSLEDLLEFARSVQRSRRKAGCGRDTDGSD